MLNILLYTLLSVIVLEFLLRTAGNLDSFSGLSIHNELINANKCWDIYISANGTLFLNMCVCLITFSVLQTASSMLLMCCIWLSRNFRRPFQKGCLPTVSLLCERLYMDNYTSVMTSELCQWQMQYSKQWPIQAQTSLLLNDIWWLCSETVQVSSVSLTVIQETSMVLHLQMAPQS